MHAHTQPQRILLLTSATGGGHISLAEALRERLQSAFACTVVDPQPGFVRTHYRMVSRYALRLWQAEYQFANRPQRALTAQTLMARLLQTPMARVVAEAAPDLIISTYPLFTAAVRGAIQRSRRATPLALLLADPQDVHAAWLAIKDVEAVLSPTRETWAQSRAEGFSEAQVHLSGWPVRQQFYTAFDQSQGESAAAARAAALRELGLEPNRLTIFLQGGGEGSARFAQTVETVLNVNAHRHNHAAQVILATGTNTKLQERFANIPRIHPLPFTKEIARYMALSDVIMGKAGPNMIFESVTLGKPFIATTYIPGQEAPNLEFIRRYNLGWVALESDTQAALIQSLLHNPAQISAQAEAVRHYRAWNVERYVTVLPAVQRLLGQPALATA
jgi:UDP-N-acetylglucosamine:LPS N-acetylglucosamine transferase